MSAIGSASGSFRWYCHSLFLLSLFITPAILGSFIPTTLSAVCLDYWPGKHWAKQSLHFLVHLLPPNSIPLENSFFLYSPLWEDFLIFLEKSHTGKFHITNDVLGSKHKSSSAFAHSRLSAPCLVDFPEFKPRIVSTYCHCNSQHLAGQR